MVGELHQQMFHERLINSLVLCCKHRLRPRLVPRGAANGLSYLSTGGVGTRWCRLRVTVR